MLTLARGVDIGVQNKKDHVYEMWSLGCWALFVLPDIIP